MFQSFLLTGNFATGANLAIGDLNGDGYAELIVGTFDGVIPKVKVFGGGALVTKNTLNQLAVLAPSGAISPFTAVAWRFATLTAMANSTSSHRSARK